MGQPLTAEQIQTFNTSVRTAFNKGLGNINKDWELIARMLPSSASSNTYAWMTQIPAFREWVGARVHKLIEERAYNVPNKKFEFTFDVPRDDFEDNNLGQYSGIAEGAPDSYADLLNDLTFMGIKNGRTSVCYDGQYFFDTDHPVAANEDGTGAVETVSNYQDGAGEMFVLLCTKRGPKPLYLQNRTGKPQLIAKTNAATSDAVFETDVFSWGARWRGNFAYGFWQLAFASKAELTQANLYAAIKSMMTVKADGNRQLNIVADTLVVGPDNYEKADTLINQPTLANGASNPMYKRFRLVVNPLMLDS